MWSDMYCGGEHCPQTGPWSIWYDPEFDDLFADSFSGLTWPRASVAGASLWHYVQTLDATSTLFNDIITNHNARLVDRGSNTCPNGCLCDWNSRYECLACAPCLETFCRRHSHCCHKSLLQSTADLCRLCCRRHWDRCGHPYGATPPLSTNIKLTNTADFKMTVKAATPCMKTYGDVLAILQPGESVIVYQVRQSSLATCSYAGLCLHPLPDYCCFFAAATTQECLHPVAS